MTTTAWAAKSPDGEIDVRTTTEADPADNSARAEAFERLIDRRQLAGESWNAAALRLTTAGWRIVKVKIEEVE